MKELEIKFTSAIIVYHLAIGAILHHFIEVFDLKKCNYKDKRACNFKKF